MYKTIIVLPDGTELSSGVTGQVALQSATITECVNSGQELSPGSCCPAMLEAKIIVPGGNSPISAGDLLTVYREDETGSRHRVGVFVAEKPTKTSANKLSLTAYDKIILLDKDLTEWLSGISSWPVPLYDVAFRVCAECGLELVNEEIPNGDYQVQRFSASGITGRKLLEWVGQISGQFVRATIDGKVEFAWYETLTGYGIAPTSEKTENSGSVIYKDGEIIITGAAVASEYSDGNLTLYGVTATEGGNGELLLTVSGSSETQFYYMGSLSYEEYDVAPIEKVQLRQNEEDVGTVYPDTSEALNTYAVTGNLLLSSMSGDDLVEVAATLYVRLQGLSYRPCKVSIPNSFFFRPGHVLRVTDINGKSFLTLIMSKTSTGLRDTLECTGSPNRGSSTAVNNQEFKSLEGKVLNLRTDVDGLKVENAGTKGNLSRLELTIDNISGTVQRQDEESEALKTQLTTVQQTADGLSIRVASIETDGAKKVETGLGYTFDDKGLHIQNPGQQMENRLDHAGMEVTRSGEPMLRADKDGVIATDVSVRNYLTVGDHARFENYGGGTGCFYVGG